MNTNPIPTTAALLLTLLAGTTQTSALDLACLNGQNGFVLNGINAGDQSGSSVSAAGDINGDGIDDIIIGAWTADPQGYPGAGESYIVFGGASVGSSGSLELASLNGTNGFVIRGANAYDQSGFPVSSAGDVNGDGVDDLIIGAWPASPNGSHSGASYVVFGSESIGTSGSFELASLNGTNGFVINGIDEGDYSGSSVSSAGDVNGDGIHDLIVGATNADPNGISRAGESYVVFGGASVGTSGSIELSSLNGTNGYVINGVAPYDLSGQSVSSAGDMNGDGIGDILIGAWNAAPNGNSQAGVSYIVFGGANVGTSGSIELASLNGSDGYCINGVDAFDTSGISVASAGDINADGSSDLIIGASNASPNSNEDAGESYIVFGGASVGASGSIELATLDGTNGFAINGIDANDFSGFSVSGAGDVNGDGTKDIIIGSLLFVRGDSSTSGGESYVVFGGADVGTGGSVELSALDNTNGFIINGIDAGDRSGRSVSGAGDINADGIDDIIVGASRADPNGTNNAGQTYVIFGSTTGFTAPEDLNASGCVTADDLTLLIAAWNTPAADLNNDGTTNSTDLAILLAAWTN